MKIKKLIAPILITVLMFSTAVFADDDDSSSDSAIPVRPLVIAKEDPVNMLQNLKDKVQQAETSNKISQERAESLNQLIDQKIILFKRISNTLPVEDYIIFSSDDGSEPLVIGNMSLDEKRSQVKKDAISYIDDMAKAGLINSSEATSYFVSYMVSISNWDGKGYPDFYLKQIKQFSDKVVTLLNNEF